MKRFSALACGVSVTALLCTLAACPPAEQKDPGPQVEPPDTFCPGSAGCETSEGVLRAGAAKRAITPDGYEIAKAQFLKGDRINGCEPGLPKGHPETTCGILKETFLDDCGNDGICFGEEGYPGADEDGSEGDGNIKEWFWDCGRDRICPPPHDTPEEGELATNGIDDDGDGAIDEGPYTGPDADGTEGDGNFQALWIAGYDNNRPAMGVKDDIWARVVVFEVGDTNVAMITHDTVGLFIDEMVRIKALVDEARPGALDQLIFQSTHTHEAPDTAGQWGFALPFDEYPVGPGRDEPFMQKIRDVSAEAILEALDNLEEAEVSVGTINTAVDGFLRDSRDPKIYNDLMTVVQVTAKGSGETIATLANWGNHPEILDSRNNYVSSDFAHAMREALENGLPATDTHPAYEGLGGIAIYQQGNVGGLMGPNGFVVKARDGTEYEQEFKTWARCDAYGELLADQAFQALETAEKVEIDSIRFSTKGYIAPIKNRVFQLGFSSGWFDRQVLGEGGGEFDFTKDIDDDNVPYVPSEVAMVKMGPITWLTAPGEIFPELVVGYDPKFHHGQGFISDDNENPPDMDKAPKDRDPLLTRMDSKYTIILGLGQDFLGYLVPPWQFELAEGGPYINEAPGDHYEETNSIGPEHVPLMLESMESLFVFEAERDAEFK
jgi:hypothetical protein